MTYIQLKDLFEEQSILNNINGILSWDMATYMPKKSRSQRIKQIKKIYDYKKRIFDQIKKNDLIKKAENSNLNGSDKLNLKLMKDRFEYFDSIPYEKIKKKAALAIECEGVWREAKEKSNFKLVQKNLLDLVNQIKEESEILSQKKNKKKYDCLLSNYDRSLDTKQLFKIFKRIEKFISNKLPLIEKKQKTFSYLELKENLSEEDQFKLSKIFMKKLGFDFNKGRIDKSHHPFCGGSSEDIRITTRFDENDSFSCFDALMHETGHALYEQSLPKKWMHQPIGNAGGMSLHESQSLFIEMQMIKSLPVSYYIEKILKKIKKKSNIWNKENIYRIRNKVKKNFIRVEADEVNYPLHIIHRFNVEHKIIEENASINNLPDIWNEEFHRLFKLKVKNDKDGCLQDIHWFGGDFGYFPTYSIGAFIAAQLMNQIKNEIPDLNHYLASGNFKIIIKWLNKNIHAKGSLYKINDLLKSVTNEKLNLKYFENHIVKKYLKGNI